MKTKAWVLIACFLIAGCAASKKLVVWEIKDIPRPYQVLGPVSVTEEVAESKADMIQGIAGYISRDGRVSDQVPAEVKQALENKKGKYKDMIFEKLGDKAKEYGADAVIEGEYTYVPAYVSLSTKAAVSAKGTMVKYKD